MRNVWAHTTTISTYRHFVNLSWGFGDFQGEKVNKHLLKRLKKFWKHFCLKVIIKRIIYTLYRWVLTDHKHYVDDAANTKETVYTQLFVSGQTKFVI